MDAGKIIYPYWRILYFCFAMILIGLVFAFLQFTTFGMVVCALAWPIGKRLACWGSISTVALQSCLASPPRSSGLAGVMYTPINPPNYHMGMDFLVISFVVVVVGGMGSLPGAVLAGLLLGILESFASMREVIAVLPEFNQVVIYLAAIIILLTRPRGLMGRKGVMED